VNTLQNVIKTNLTSFILAKQRRPKSQSVSLCNLKESTLKVEAKQPLNQISAKLLSVENTKFIAQVFKDYEKSMQQVESLG
jgi:hypothetical protein